MSETQRMKYSTPATDWSEALPIGNGRLGAMIPGGVPHERICINEDTVWAGHAVDRVNPRGRESLDQVRQLIFAGREADAMDLISQTMFSTPPRIQPYQPMAWLEWHQFDCKWHNTYTRRLDLGDGIVTVDYRHEFRARGIDHHYIREYFASAVDDVLVVRLRADTPGSVGLRVRLDRDQHTTRCESEDARLVLEGQLGDKGVGICMMCHILHKGGRLERRGNAVAVLEADEVTLLIAGATSYRGPTDLSGDPAGRCRETLDRAAAKGIEAIRADHVADHRRLMDRVTIDLPGTDPDVSELPMNERLARFREHDDPALVALNFQYCRYLLMASSRPGSMPPNLQGIWNESHEPNWESDYHTNINIQMAYFQAEVCNLSECHQPLMDFMLKCLPSGRKTARDLYGCRGWVMHHVSDPFCTTAPIGGGCSVWPLGSGWLCMHAWEHFRYTRDDVYLRDTAWPLMSEAARFYLDFLVEAPADTPHEGSLVTAPSHSPENSFVDSTGRKSWYCYAATMDMQIIRELFQACLAAADVLGHDDAILEEIRAALPRLLPNQISPKTGRLQEWPLDYDEVEPGHRHLSHLYSVFPGDGIDPTADPALADAAAKSLVYRQKHMGGSGRWTVGTWQVLWRAALWARLGDGEQAWPRLIDSLRDDDIVTPNLFNTLMQVSDYMGFSAVLAEMLLQSHRDCIHLLPALPKALASGRIAGLRARGGFTVGIEWADGRLTRATIRADRPGPVAVASPHAELSVTDNGEPVATQRDHGMLRFDAAAGREYVLTPA